MNMVLNNPGDFYGKKRKGQTYEILTFYEEIPVKGKGMVLNVDKVWEWQVDKKLILPVNYSRKIFFQEDGKWYSADVIIATEDYVNTTPPVVTYDPKLRRKFPRVAVSYSSPITLVLRSIYDFDKEKRYKMLDVSEMGFSFVAGEDEQFQEGDDLEALLEIEYPDGKREIARGKAKIVREEEIKDGIKKYGCMFVSLPAREREKIARYVAKRQVEIARMIKDFIEI